MGTASVTLQNVTLRYGHHPAVEQVSGSFERGSLTAIAGPNGAGKSTLLKAIAGILTPAQGRIILEDSAPHAIAYLPQATELARDFPLSALHLVATGYWQKTGGAGAITPPMLKAASDALKQVGLAGFEKRSLTRLSSGQFQRVLFARLIVQDAPLILLDEPFSAVDAATTAQLLALIEAWHRQGRTIICVLHDFEQIRNHFPCCLLLARTCIAWEDSRAALAPERLLAMGAFLEGTHSHDDHHHGQAS